MKHCRLCAATIPADRYAAGQRFCGPTCRGRYVDVIRTRVSLALRDYPVELDCVALGRRIERLLRQAGAGVPAG